MTILAKKSCRSGQPGNRAAHAPTAGFAGARKGARSPHGLPQSLTGRMETGIRMTSIVDIEELGRRIRKLRAERRMTLKQVEHISGLSATHLSEIERGRTSPTIGALSRIARALEKDVAFFIEQEERADVAHHLREHVAGFAAGAGVTVESLTPGIPGSSLFTYRVRLEPGPGAELRLAAQDLPADAIVHVHSGRVAARIGSADHELGAGDTLQASLALGQVLRAGAAGAAELFLVSTRALEEVR
jgi:transcriptional regulator with XRE-family HTH domain